MKKMNYCLYTGTYTEHTGSEGIYVFSMDYESGKLSLSSVQKNCRNPSFLAIDSKKNSLFAANEFVDGASISSYAIDSRDGGLRYLNKSDFPGSKMCHISLSDDGRYLFAANFGSGNILSCSVREDGSVGDLISCIWHHGSSVRAQQTQQHAHEAVLDPENRYLISVDLGMDKLMVYRFDPLTGALTPNDFQRGLAVDAGEGPRHIIFHPNHKWCYLITELNNHIYQYDYDGRNGTFHERQKIPLCPPEYQVPCKSAEVQITNDGRFLLASTRGNDRISRFRINPLTGGLSNLVTYPCLGKGPRMFDLDPENRFIVIANQMSDHIVVCRFDKVSGEILEECCEIRIPQPSFVKVVAFSSPD